MEKMGLTLKEASKSRASDINSFTAGRKSVRTFRVQDWAKDDHSNAAAAGVYGKDGGRP